MNRPAIFRQGGFSIIELAIVVTIVAVLTLLAVPAYQDSVRKGRRGDAKSDLVQLAQFMERCYTLNSTYAACSPITGTPGGAALVAPYTNSPGFGSPTPVTPISYVFGITVAAGRGGYQITAVPQGDQVNDKCSLANGAASNLSIDNTGAKLPVVGSNGVACW